LALQEQLVGSNRLGPGRPRPSSAGHDVLVVDEDLAQQVSYYRKRAAEYDVTAYGDVTGARVRIDRLVTQLQPSGEVLEIACGTGIWTAAFA
jgi:2-polyprenyl-3-methyl-5-hydroxy-6-metoxy-1,4-benzoquinol methylase